LSHLVAPIENFIACREVVGILKDSIIGIVALKDGMAFEVVEAEEKGHGRHDEDEADLSFSGKSHDGQK
jgi:hypothetical protein